MAIQNLLYDPSVTVLKANISEVTLGKADQWECRIYWASQSKASDLKKKKKFFKFEVSDWLAQ